MSDEDKSSWIRLAYVGERLGMTTLSGHFGRQYSFRKGDVIPVHPDDVRKLKKTNLFVDAPVIEEVDTADLDAKEPDDLNRDDAPVIEEVDTAGRGEEEQNDLNRDPEGAHDDSQAEIDATSGAIELAQSAGVDLIGVGGTGQNGRITKADVQAFLDAQND